MINKNIIFILTLLAIINLLLVSTVKSTYAQAVTSLINATVKINVCGDGLIEGGEDCEGTDLNGQSCPTLGYLKGTLSCDIACSFDTTDCSGSTPTAILTLTPTPTLTLSTTTNSTPTSTPAESLVSALATATPTPLKAPASRLLQAPVTIVTPSLPLPVMTFDTDGNGKLETTEIYLVVKDWVDQWREYIKVEFTPSNEKVEKNKCDVNLDQQCNLFDFSILMYYVER